MALSTAEPQNGFQILLNGGLQEAPYESVGEVRPVCLLLLKQEPFPVLMQGKLRSRIWTEMGSPVGSRSTT